MIYKFLLESGSVQLNTFVQNSLVQNSLVQLNSFKYVLLYYKIGKLISQYLP